VRERKEKRKLGGRKGGNKTKERKRRE